MILDTQDEDIRRLAEPDTQLAIREKINYIELSKLNHPTWTWT